MDKWIAFVKIYLWEVIACLVSPVLATRFTNVIKAFKRIWFKNPWPAVIWHTLTWVLTFFFSWYALRFKYPTYPEEIAFISIILASFNSGVVEYMHRRAAEHDASNAVFNKILYMDEDEIDVGTRLGAFASGMTVKVDRRTKERIDDMSFEDRQLAKTVFLDREDDTQPKQ